MTSRAPSDLISDKSPRLHDVGQQRIELFVRGDFEKIVIVNEPLSRVWPTPAVKPRNVIAGTPSIVLSCRSFITPEGWSYEQWLGPEPGCSSRPK